MGGPIAKDDALALAGICDAAANCYVLDAKRSEPKYNHPASITSSFKRIGETGMSLHINKDHLSEMSYPIGWVMDERYPGLSDLLGGYMDARKQESQVSRNNIATNLRVLRDALKYAYK